MMTRCYNEKHEYFYRYGGRGISVTQDWHDCKKFVVEIESLLGPKPPGLQMDRIENDGNYDKKNIRWATRIENCRNRHDNMQTVYKGTPMLLLEAAELSGIHVTVLRQRVRAKRPMERLFDPVRVPYHI